jgi:hypothetical protein
MDKGKVLFKIEVMGDGSIKIFDSEKRELHQIDPKAIPEYLNKSIVGTLITPMFTYLKTNSGVIIINGVAYRVP